MLLVEPAYRANYRGCQRYHRANIFGLHFRHYRACSSRELQGKAAWQITMQYTTTGFSYVLILILRLACSWRTRAAEIVGLWLITVSYQGSVVDNVFSGWTSDGLEFDQDTGSPMLTGYICYGTWIKLRDHKYGAPRLLQGNNSTAIGISPYEKYLRVLLMMR